MGGLTSRNKGKRGEREVINLLQPILDEVYGAGQITLQRNTLQSDKGGCDIAGHDKFAIEIKRQEKLSVKSWWRQTLAQCKDWQIPVLFYRQNGAQWQVMYHSAEKEVVTVSFDVFADVFRQYLQNNPL